MCSVQYRRSLVSFTLDVRCNPNRSKNSCLTNYFCACVCRCFLDAVLAIGFRNAGTRVIFVSVALHQSTQQDRRCSFDVLHAFVVVGVDSTFVDAVDETFFFGK